MSETLTVAPTQSTDATIQPKTDSAIPEQPAQPAAEGQGDGRPAKTKDPMQDVFTPPTPPAKPATPVKDAKDKPAETAKAKDDKAAPQTDRKTVGTKPDNSVITQIRNAEKAAKAEASEWKARHDELLKRGNGDTSALTKTIEEQQKRITELEGEVGTLNYRKHPDFVSKHEKPYMDAQKAARTVIESLNVVTGTDEEGKPTTRRASWESDFLTLTAIDPNKSPAENRARARDRAKALFGEDAADAMQQWDRLYDLNEKRQGALKEYSEKRGEFEAQERSKEIQHKQNFQKAFKLAIDDLLETNRELFGERPDDAEGNEMMKKMDTLIDPVFSAPETLAPEEFVARLASIKHRVRTYPRLQRDLAAALDRAAELEARINGAEESASGKTKSGVETVRVTDDLEKAEREMFGG